MSNFDTKITKHLITFSRIQHLFRKNNEIQCTQNESANFCK